MKAQNIRRNAVVIGSALAVTTAGSFTAFAAGHANHAALHPIARAASHKTLHVVETDYHIALGASSGSAGTYTITDKNNSRDKHGLVFNGPGQKKKLLFYVGAHKTKTATIKLKKGKYDVYCPVPGHKMLGMNTHFTVK